MDLVALAGNGQNEQWQQGAHSGTDHRKRTDGHGRSGFWPAHCYGKSAPRRREDAKGLGVWGDRWSAPVIGAAIEVHKALGPGLLESVYELALEQEVRVREIPFERQRPVPIRYRDLILDGGLRLDFVVGDELILELKSVAHLIDIHEAQLLTYMKLTGYPVGLLINFNVAVLRRGIRRLVHQAPG